MKSTYLSILSGMLCTSMLITNPAFADSSEELLKQMQVMQKQIEQLQKQLVDVQKKASAADKTAKVASANATAAKAAALEPAAGKSSGKKVADAKPADPNSTGIVLGNKNNIKLTMGGFIEAAGILRSRNETADMGSDFGTGMPFPISPNYHMSEFRGSARQSRLSLLAEGRVDPDTALAAYFEFDFLGAAVTANSRESNSYTPRIRQIFASLDRSDLGVNFLAGQAWSMATLNKQGIVARQENVPLTIDAQYVPGFNWTRNPQARVVKTFWDKKLSAGLSFESPQAIIFNGPNSVSGSTFNNSGGSQLNSTTTYSTDLAPDIIAKIALDPGYGHYETYGLARFFRDRNNFHNTTIMGGGLGGGAILPLIEKKLEFQLSGLVGTGIGRYGSSQLPDITIKPDGSIATVDSWDLLAGLVGHPNDQWDVYAYGGTERALKKAFTSGINGYGYGSPLYNNSSCLTEGGTAGNCVANTQSIDQFTAGFWWKFYKGSYGTMQMGLQDSYTTRDTFAGVGGSPSTDENVTMISFRYYPF